ncbi:MAG TPA: hypothetical protein VMS31_05590 [Pyrinomonadaceae bacterium]|nr:hypothetical protein [Pyrinomonadaceae bacterium]
MHWEKRGLIFQAKGTYEWMMHHASIPCADKISEEVVRIYFGPRDSRGRTHTAFIDVEAGDPQRIIRVHDRPVLSPGQLGGFDDSGAMPSCIVNHEGRKYLYYIGWNEGVTVPYRNAIGVAVSDDNGISFTRVFPGPVIDRTCNEPFFTATPYILIENGLWRCWYASSTGYFVVEGKPEPVYQIKYAESDDGLSWRRPNLTCIPYQSESEANARPSVMKEDDKYLMWYCYRESVGYRTDKAKSYRMGYAESPDGLSWVRMDDRVGIDRSESGWDSMMIAYPNVYEHGGRKYMLYCGNGFGEAGFGYAVMSEC